MSAQKWRIETGNGGPYWLAFEWKNRIERCPQNAPVPREGFELTIDRIGFRGADTDGGTEDSGG